MPERTDVVAYRIKDVCRTLSLGRSSIYGMIRKGQLNSVKIAGRTLILRSEIERLVREATNNA